jgi:hypothetical protein
LITPTAVNHNIIRRNKLNNKSIFFTGHLFQSIKKNLKMSFNKPGPIGFSYMCMTCLQFPNSDYAKFKIGEMQKSLDTLSNLFTNSSPEVTATTASRKGKLFLYKPS